MGTETVSRSCLTISKILSVVTPPDKALMFASWITGPSAVGSEKGMPSSIRSAPAAAISFTMAMVVSRSGSPQVIKGINAFPFAKASCILLINILPSVSGNGGTVLIAAAGNGDYNDLIFGKRRRKLLRIGNGMSAFDSRDNSFCFR